VAVWKKIPFYGVFLRQAKNNIFLCVTSVIKTHEGLVVWSELWLILAWSWCKDYSLVSDDRAVVNTRERRAIGVLLQRHCQRMQRIDADDSPYPSYQQHFDFAEGSRFASVEKGD